MDAAHQTTIIVGGITALGSVFGIVHSLYSLRAVRRQLLEKTPVETGTVAESRIHTPTLEEIVKYGGNPYAGASRSNDEVADVGQVERLPGWKDPDSRAQQRDRHALWLRLSTGLARLAPSRLLKLSLTRATKVSSEDVRVLSGISRRIAWSVAALIVGVVLVWAALGLR